MLALCDGNHVIISHMGVQVKPTQDKIRERFVGRPKCSCCFCWYWSSHSLNRPLFERQAKGNNNTPEHSLGILSIKPSMPLLLSLALSAYIVQ